MRLTWVVCGVVLAGCAGSVKTPLLNWPSQVAAEKAEGHVAIGRVVSRRSAGHGGGDLNWIGISRGTMDIPEQIRVDDTGRTGRPVSTEDSLRRFLDDSLRAAGFGTTSASDPAATAQIVIEVRDLFSDGSTADWSGTVALDLVIIDPKTGAERTRFDVEASGSNKRKSERCKEYEGMTTNPSTLNFCTLYDEAFSNLEQDLSQALRRPDVRAAMLAAAPPAPRCNEDKDCQDDRVCADGQCVNQ
jgi:hypothetical protein